jgi:cytochrome P450
MTGFDPLSTEIRRCPHPHYAALNETPVQAVEGHPNFYLVSGYKTVSEVLTDPETYDGQPFPDSDVPVMSAMRPEPHKRVRSAVQSMFTTSALATLTPLITETARVRTRQLLAAGGGELMDLWANPIPLTVIASMFGFPAGPADLARLNRYGDAAVRLVIPYGGPGLPVPTGPRERWRQASGLLKAVPAAFRLVRQMPRNDRRALGAFPNPFADKPGYPRTGFAQHPDLIHLVVEFQLEVLKIVREHQKNPGDEVVDALVRTYQAGEISLPEILSSALQVLVAGYETTASTLAHAVNRLIEQDGLLETLRNEPERIPAFIEEILRLDAPLQRTLRRTTRPVELAGVALPENAQLIVMLGAANLDATRFEDPAEMDLERSNAKRHLAFGRGIHMCLGAQLARLETQIALTEFVQQIGSVRLAQGAAVGRLTDKDIGMWGIDSLPIVVEPAPAGLGLGRPT